MSLFTLEADVEGAFDNIVHIELAGSLSRKVADVLLQLAILREYRDAQLCGEFQNTPMEPISYTEGGWQGGTITPLVRLLHFDDTMTDTVRGWEREGVGVDLEDGFPVADNLWLVAMLWEFFNAPVR